MDLLGPEDVLSGAVEAELPPRAGDDGLATTEEETPPSDGDLILETGAPADSDPKGRPPEIVAALEADEPLDPALEELFLEANAEAEKEASVSELPDIPIRELLNELVALGRSLGIEPSTPAEASNGAQASAEPVSPQVLEDHPASAEARWPSPTFSRRHALCSMLLSLTFVMAIASVLVGADRIVSNGQNQGVYPAVATVSPGVAVRQKQPNEPAVEPTSEAIAPPTATRPPAYFLYTVQRGDTLTAIAATFGLSLDHIIWTNPDVINDPNLLYVGDKLLIPNVTGMIYFVEPGDILSVIGRLLPDAAPDDSGDPSQRPGPP